MHTERKIVLPADKHNMLQFDIIPQGPPNNNKIEVVKVQSVLNDQLKDEDGNPVMPGDHIVRVEVHTPAADGQPPTSKLVNLRGQPISAWANLIRAQFKKTLYLESEFGKQALKQFREWERKENEAAARKPEYPRGARTAHTSLRF